MLPATPRGRDMSIAKQSIVGTIIRPQRRSERWQPREVWW